MRVPAVSGHCHSHADCASVAAPDRVPAKRRGPPGISPVPDVWRDCGPPHAVRPCGWRSNRGAPAPSRFHAPASKSPCRTNGTARPMQPDTPSPGLTSGDGARLRVLTKYCLITNSYSVFTHRIDRFGRIGRAAGARPAHCPIRPMRAGAACRANDAARHTIPRARRGLSRGGRGLPPRPPWVFMRARKPCVRARFTLEGW